MARSPLLPIGLTQRPFPLFISLALISLLRGTQALLQAVFQ
jgi:hypothetical protein